MTLYYCDSEKAFYNTAVHAVGQIPVGAVEISKALYEKLRDGQSGLKRIGLDANGVPVLLDVVMPAPDYPALIASKRYERETAGIAVEGLLIDTARDSQALIAGTGLSAVLDPEYRCNFKTLNGFVEIDAAQIIVIAKAVRAHVQVCFDRELTLLRALEAGAYSSDMLNEGWPDSPVQASEPG
jgi:hypothetical protein